MPDIIVTAIIACLLLTIGVLFLFTQYYKVVPSGFAMIRFGQGGNQVSFNKMMVYPVIHRIEYLDVSLKNFTITRENENGVICLDNLRINLRADFYMKVNHSAEDVMKIAQSIGCKRGSDPHTLAQLFEARFSEAIKTVTKEYTYEDILKERERYKIQILEHIGGDLSGYILDRCCISWVSLTPQKYLDPNNLLDAEALKTFTRKMAIVQQTNNEKEVYGHKKLSEDTINATENTLMLEYYKGEAEAIHQAKIRHMREQSDLDARLIYLEIKLAVETTIEIQKRLTKQIESLHIKRDDLAKQLEVEEKSIKVRYQRKLLESRRSNEIPPDKQ